MKQGNNTFIRIIVRILAYKICPSFFLDFDKKLQTWFTTEENILSVSYLDHILLKSAILPNYTLSLNYIALSGYVLKFPILGILI